LKDLGEMMIGMARLLGHLPSPALPVRELPAR